MSHPWFTKENTMSQDEARCIFQERFDKLNKKAEEENIQNQLSAQ